MQTLPLQLPPNNSPIAITLGNIDPPQTKHLMVVFGGNPIQTLGGIRVTNTSGDLGFVKNPSDYRIKTDITPVSSVVEKIKKIKVVSYTDTRFDTKVPYGFVAHELQEQVPTAVLGEKDAVNEDGTPNMQGIDQTKLIPLLTKALQEALERIEALENA